MKLLAIIATARPAALAVSESRTRASCGSNRLLSELIIAADGTEPIGTVAPLGRMAGPRGCTTLGFVPISRRNETTSPEQTEAVAAELAAGLSAGDVVLVEGELGAGKTTFVRGACRALAVTGPVTSPTFTIGQRYPAPVPISHLDLYRVVDLGDEEPDLLADYLGSDRIAFVEWPGGASATIAGLARLAAKVSIEHGGGDRRIVTIEAP
jgi:tRNA threonylcarbamoyladenosine biosynthesis protein TsaE